MREELAFALELADEADAIAMRYFSHAPEVFTKQDGTLVTRADREIEEALRARIERRYPHHTILGEEAGLQGTGGGPRWVIDPIDGTNNFAWGIPIFGTLIALQVEGASEVGVASAPALGERYDAALGEGARLNGSPIHVSGAATIEEARLVFATWEEWIAAGLEERWGALCARSRRSRGFGDFWAHMLVARGAADVMAEPEVELWDIAALEAIVIEAGGRLTDFAGRPFRGRGSCLTTNGALHDAVMEGLGTVGTG
jgi:histidinol-phosphatase